jgi:hypothetical protein
MTSSRESLIQTKNAPQRIAPNRRTFLFGAAAAFATSRTPFAGAFAPLADHTGGPLKIEAVELLELHGRYTEEAGVNRQPQVNPLDVYDDLRPAPYTDKPSGSKKSLLAPSTSASEPPEASTDYTAPSKKTQPS